MYPHACSAHVNVEVWVFAAVDVGGKVPTCKKKLCFMSSDPCFLYLLFLDTLHLLHRSIVHACITVLTDDPTHNLSHVHRYVNSVMPGHPENFMLEYLEKACLVHIWDGVLFVHGGATACTLGWNVKLGQRTPANNPVSACNGAYVSALIGQCCACACPFGNIILSAFVGACVRAQMTSIPACCYL